MRTLSEFPISLVTESIQVDEATSEWFMSTFKVISDFSHDFFFLSGKPLPNSEIRKIKKNTVIKRLCLDKRYTNTDPRKM